MHMIYYEYSEHIQYIFRTYSEHIQNIFIYAVVIIGFKC